MSDTGLNGVRVGAMLVVCGGVLAGCASQASRPSAPPSPWEISGRAILTISDADMAATAFVDRRLGERAAGSADALTIIGLPLANPDNPEDPTWTTPYAQARVSNSAFGPPPGFDATPDGQTVLVVESRGPAPEGALTLDDLAPGTRLSAVSLADPLEPVLLSQQDVGDMPSGVAVHPSGGFAAVITRQQDQELNIVPISASGVLEAPIAFPLVLPEGMDSPGATIAWHPSGDYFAVTLPLADAVAFFEYTMIEGRHAIRAHGSPARVGKHPYNGAFTPNGRHFVTADTQWGPDVEGFLIGAGEGTVSVVRFDPRPRDSSGFSPTHELVDQEVVGVSPEGLAIHPSGGYVVTGNLRRSFLPESDPRFTRGGSLSLLQLNVRTGDLRPIDEWAIEAMPEGIAFDADGEYVVVTQFRSFDPAAVDGELAFWRLSGEGLDATLEPADFYVGVGKGPHGVMVLPR